MKHGVQTIVRLARHYMVERIFPRLPRDWDGRLQFTFHNRRMPEEWLWRPDCLLPAVVAVGAMRYLGEILPVRSAPDSVIGYVLEDGEHQFSPELLDAAFEVIRPESHHPPTASAPNHPTPAVPGDPCAGTHLETMWLLGRPAFGLVLKFHGLDLPFPTWDRLPNKFLNL